MTRKLFGKHKHSGPTGVSYLGVGLKKRIAKAAPEAIVAVNDVKAKVSTRKVRLRKAELDE